MSGYRIEKDSMGKVRVPRDALYGAQTQRAIDNFPVSGIRFPRIFIRALGLIKGASAEVNGKLGLLDASMAEAIAKAAEEVSRGLLDKHFPLDIFQTGSGTSTNMNANEVIAKRAGRILGKKGLSAPHPNDHVNMGQSSNDVIPAAIHVSACIEAHEGLLPSFRGLHNNLLRRAKELDSVVKTGRTHLMDALPISLGQEIGGWAYQVSQGIRRIESTLPGLYRLSLGGTAVGTGVNCHPEFGRRVAKLLASRTGIPFTETENHFAYQSSMDSASELSSQLKTIASSLMKIANDLRLMNSGPMAGFGEITLPPLQPGSSIMPGKVNPVVCESVMMVCAQVIGNDIAVTIGNGAGNFELNVMLPLIAHNLLESMMIIGNAAHLLSEKAVAGFKVNRKRMEELVEKNPMLVTALNPLVGYDMAARIAKRAYEEGRSIKDVALEMTGLSKKELEKALDPASMIGGGIKKKKKA
jgi:fumarate hydratase class II